MKKRGIELVRDLSICPIVKYTFRYDVRTNRLNEYSRWNSSTLIHLFGQYANQLAAPSICLLLSITY